MKAKKNRFQIQGKQKEEPFTHSHYNPSNPVRSPAGRSSFRGGRSCAAQAVAGEPAGVPDLADGVSVVLLDGPRGQAAAAAQQVPVQLQRAAHQLRLRQRGHGRSARGPATHNGAQTPSALPAATKHQRRGAAQSENTAGTLRIGSTTCRNFRRNPTMK